MGSDAHIFLQDWHMYFTMAYQVHICQKQFVMVKACLHFSFLAQLASRNMTAIDLCRMLQQLQPWKT